MFKRNVIANYLGQGYIAAVGILIVPFYLEQLGTEGYGLVGIFTMLQAWLQLLDIGISTTLAREAAKSKINTANALFFKKLKFVVVSIFFTVGLILFLISVWAKSYIIENWLSTSLSEDTVTISLLAIMFSVTLRWCSAPWRSAIVGLEKQVILNITQVTITTLRFPCSLIVMSFSEEKITTFFKYQALIAVLELVTYFALANIYSPKATGSILPNRNFLTNAKSTFKFALAIGFTSSVWVVVTQLDKLILSSLISLQEYGYYSVAVMAASGISMLSMPVAQAITPRLTNFFEQGDLVKLKEQYANTTKLVAAIVAPASIILGVFAEEVLFIWTRDHEVVNGASNILRWYAWGNGLLALAAFPYYLQYAYGKLRLHVIGNVIFAIFLFPTIYLVTKSYGAEGAAKVWFVQNLFFFLCWTWVIHNKFLKNYHLNWLISNIFPFTVGPVLVAIFSKLCLGENSLFFTIAMIALTSMISLSINLFIYNRPSRLWNR